MIDVSCYALQGLCRVTRVVLLAAIAIGPTAVSGCSSTQAVGDWRSPEYTGGTFESFFVLALVPRADVRHRIEDEFTRQLAQRGVTAEPSYRRLPDIDTATREDVERVVGESGLAGVLVTRLTDTEQRVDEAISPTPSSAATVGAYYGGWTHASAPIQSYSYNVYTLRTSLFDAAGATSLVWTGTTETIDPRRPSKNVPDGVGVILGRIEKAGLVSAEQN